VDEAEQEASALQTFLEPGVASNAEAGGSD
jgi:hypothetical protein